MCEALRCEAVLSFHPHGYPHAMHKFWGHKNSCHSAAGKLSSDWSCRHATGTSRKPGLQGVARTVRMFSAVA